MKARVLFWAGVPAHNLPMRDVLHFNEYAEDILEEFSDMLKAAVAEGVGEVVDNIEF